MNLEHEDINGRRRSRILKAGILAAIVILILGNVFAASITVNSGSPLTFGQGQASVTACDATVNYSVGSAFINGEFKLDNVTVQIDDSACASKTLILIPYEVVGGSTNSLGAATVAIPASSPFDVVVTTGTSAENLADTILAADVAGVALEIKD